MAAPRRDLPDATPVRDPRRARRARPAQPDLELQLGRDEAGARLDGPVRIRGMARGTRHADVVRAAALARSVARAAALEAAAAGGRRADARLPGARAVGAGRRWRRSHRAARVHDA